MDNILIIVDDVLDRQILDFAYRFAYTNGKKLILAKTNKPILKKQVGAELATAQYSHLQKQSKLNIQREFIRYANPEPGEKTIDASGFSEKDMAAYIRQEGFSLVICREKDCRLDLQTVLNQINCPLMLLPAEFNTAEINRIVYLTDLRYCQQWVVNRLAKYNGSSILLAHICEQGLPDLTQAYADILFEDTIGQHKACPELFFSHIKDTNIEKVVDTLINTMQADMLVCLNRKFHFQQILGEQYANHLPKYMSVPLLIFPC